MGDYPRIVYKYPYDTIKKNCYICSGSGCRYWECVDAKDETWISMGEVGYEKVSEGYYNRH